MAENKSFPIKISGQAGDLRLVHVRPGALFTGTRLALQCEGMVSLVTVMVDGVQQMPWNETADGLVSGVPLFVFDPQAVGCDLDYTTFSAESHIAFLFHFVSDCTIDGEISGIVLSKEEHTECLRKQDAMNVLPEASLQDDADIDHSEAVFREFIRASRRAVLAAKVR